MPPSKKTTRSSKSSKYTKKSKRPQPISRETARRLIILGAILLVPLVIAGFVGAGSMQLENHDSFCASCHSEPESQYFQREAAAPADLASFHSTKSTRCIDCHSGQGLPGRAVALTLGAKDLIAFTTKHYTQPAPLTRKIGDGNCLKCHADVTQKQDFNNHFHVFLSRWQKQDPQAATCVDCHQSHTTNGDSTIGFLNQETTVQVCQHCHSVIGES